MSLRVIINYLQLLLWFGLPPQNKDKALYYIHTHKCLNIIIEWDKECCKTIHIGNYARRKSLVVVNFL